MIEATHHGRKRRNIRILVGMKQELFGWKLGVTQQYVSKLEKQKKISPDKLKAAAKVLGVSVEAIENFNENTLFNAAMKQETGRDMHSMKEVIEYFRDELSKKDKKIEELETELMNTVTLKKSCPEK